MSTDKQHPPKSDRECQWRIKVDKQFFELDHHETTGREILTEAGRTPVEQFLLIQTGHGAPREIALDEPVDLSVPGIEHFRTIPRECREGLQGRRQFQLPEDDVSFLDSLDLEWETVIEGKVMRLVVYRYPIPAGYSHREVDLYLRIDATYPDTQIDMVYFHPALFLTSGRGIGALATEIFDGKSWQRWSRHRQSPGGWRPGIDNVESHLALVNSWLAKELREKG